MKLLDIIKTVGGEAIKNLVPGGGILVNTVNGFLKAEDRLGINATGTEMESAINKLPSAERATLQSKEFDVEIVRLKEGNETLRTMLEQEATENTRPHIALGCFYVTAICNLIIVIVWGYAVITKDSVMIAAISGSWEFIAAINAPLVTVLLSYFGNLVKEKAAKMDAATGNPTNMGLAGIINAIRK